MARFIPLLLISIAPLLAAPNENGTIIDLNGLRRARVILTAPGADYLVMVRMLPVKSFDKPTNACLNREKARQLALQALAKHLSRGKVVEFTVSGAQIVEVGTDGQFFALSLRVPREGVSLIREGQKKAGSEKHEQERIAFESDLFTRKRDYMNTVTNLAAGIASDVEKAGTTQGDSFSVVIAEIEERATKNFETLRKVIRDDSLLFSDDQDELRKAVAHQEKNMLNQLRIAVKQHGEKEQSRLRQVGRFRLTSKKLILRA